MKFKLIFLSVIFTVTLFAQRAADGELFFNNKQYTKAQAVYEGLLKRSPSNALYNFRYARCSYELQQMETAIKHFELAGKKYPLRNLYLGELYFDTYRFDESVLAYQSYMSTLKENDKRLRECEQKVKQVEKAAHLLNKVDDIAVVDSVVVNKNDFLRFYKFSSELGTLSQESLKLKANKVVDKIKYTTQRQDRVYFSDSIHGQMDIFTSIKLLDDWSKPVSVSEVINTSANENFPFLLLDGVTLYFASDGENSIGGYDIFITRYMPATVGFLTPENVGMPYNSPFNDYMMVIDEQHQKGWFATDRYQQAGKVIIYSFVPNVEKMIIRTENQDSLRSAAKLKIYRKAPKTKSDTAWTAKDQMQEQANQIEFVINDSLVYTRINQFQSKEALKLWDELKVFSSDLKSMKTQLETLRLQYANAANEDVRMSIAPKILELEAKITEQQKQISLKTLQVRNEEINYLQKKL